MKQGFPIPIVVAVLWPAVAATAGRGEQSVGGEAPQAIAVPTDAVPLPAATERRARDVNSPTAAPRADELLERLTALPALRHSAAAKVRYRAADLYGREVLGAGEYLQGVGSSRWMRYELHFRVADKTIDVLELNDGQFLWRQRTLDGRAEIERIDVDRVLDAARKEPLGPGGETAVLLGLGGIGRLPTTLHKNFDFQTVFLSELDGLPMWGVEGRWRGAALSAAGIGDEGKLPPHAPDRVVIYLGCDDLFPYRFDFFRDRRSSEAGAKQGTPLLTLEFYEVRFNVPVEAELFRFAGGSQQFIDVTERTIARRKLLP